MAMKGDVVTQSFLNSQLLENIYYTFHENANRESLNSDIAEDIKSSIECTCDERFASSCDMSTMQFVF